MKFRALFLLLMCFPAAATVLVEEPDCPVQFEGKVKEVIEAVGPTNPLSTQRVLFENKLTRRGEAKPQVAVDVLKYGPFEIEPGSEYLVQLNEGRLCWIERL
jgi:hypothetical protein